MPDDPTLNPTAINTPVAPPVEQTVQDNSTYSNSTAVEPGPEEDSGQPVNTQNDSQIISSQDSGNDGGRNKRVIATILGIVLLIAAVGTGVFLVGQQQELRIGAWDCQKYVFEVGQGGEVTVRNGSTRDEPAQQAQVYINGNLVATLDVPALDAGDASTIGTVDISNDVCSFSWEVIGTRDCSDRGGHDRDPSLSINQFSFTWSGPPQLSHATTTFCDGSSTGNVDYNEPGDSITVNFDKDIQSVDGKGGSCENFASQTCTAPTPTDGPTPTASPTPTPSSTPTVTPTPPPIGAACLNVKAYDLNWNLLTGFDLSSLKPGDVVRYAVAGTTTQGTFDKARFTINGTLRPEVSAQKPGTDEFFDEYTIPPGVESFTVSAQIHHTTLGWF